MRAWFCVFTFGLEQDAPLPVSVLNRNVIVRQGSAVEFGKSLLGDLERPGLGIVLIPRGIVGAASPKEHEQKQERIAMHGILLTFERLQLRVVVLDILVNGVLGGFVL